MGLPPGRWRPLAALGHLLLAGLLLAPAWVGAGPRLVGDARVDAWNHAWGPWWWWHCLSQGQLPWRTDLLKHPVGGVLWFIDPLLALVGAPLQPLAGAAGAYNLALLASLCATSAACHHQARRLGAGPGAAWVASGAVTAGAWVLSALHDGITEAVHLAPMAWALAEAARARTRPGPAAGLRLGLAAGLCGAASPYAGLGLAVALLGWLLAGGLGPLSRADRLRTLAPAAGLALLLAGLPAALLLAQVQAPDALVRRPGAMSEALALHNAVDPRAFLAPFGFRSVDLSAEGFQHTGYLGLVALALAGAALARDRALRPWAAAAACACVVALGPALYWGDGWVEVAGRRLPLPWAGVQALLPGLALTHPLRLAMPAVVLVGALAAVGAQALPRALRPVALLLVLLDGLWLSGAPFPVPVADARVPAVYARLPADDRAAVLDLPTDLGATMGTSRYLYWQTAHGRPVPWIPDARAHTASLVADPFFQLLAAQSARRPDEDAAAGFDRVGWVQADPDGLTAQGYRWIVLHRDLDPAAAARLEARLAWYLGPGQEAGAALWWDLAAPRPDRGEAAPPWAAEEERARRRRAVGAEP